MQDNFTYFVLFNPNGSPMMIDTIFMFKKAAHLSEVKQFAQM